MALLEAVTYASWTARVLLNGVTCTVSVPCPFSPLKFHKPTVASMTCTARLLIFIFTAICQVKLVLPVGPFSSLPQPVLKENRCRKLANRIYKPDALPAAQPAASKHWRMVNRLSMLGLTFVVPSYPGYPGKEAIKRVSVFLVCSFRFFRTH